MKDRPLIFSAPMIRALLEGRKTQTRRIIKHQPIYEEGELFPWRHRHSRSRSADVAAAVETRAHDHMIGHRFWVKENFQLPLILNTTPPRKVSDMTKVSYPATDGRLADEFDGDGALIKVRPSIHMPRRLSRITLAVTDVRVERLQDINEQDAAAEGVIPVDGQNGEANTYRAHEGTIDYPTAKWAFLHLWNYVNGSDAWQANPWVVAYTFTVQRANIDHLEAA